MVIKNQTSIGDWWSQRRRKVLNDNPTKKHENHMVDFYANHLWPWFHMFWWRGECKAEVGFLLDINYWMLWIEILTDGSFVKILSLLKWIYRNCIKCIICSKRSKSTTIQLFVCFAKWVQLLSLLFAQKHKHCIWCLKGDEQMLQTWWRIHRCQLNIKSTNCYSYWLMKYSLCIQYIYIGCC